MCWSRWARWNRSASPVRWRRSIASPSRRISTSTTSTSAWSRKVPINYAKKNRLLPLGIHQGAVTVAIADPSNYEPLDDLHVMFGMPINTVVVPGQIIDDAINRAYDQAATTTAADLMIDLEDQGLDAVASELAHETRDLLESDDAAPIIKLVNGILSQAVKDRASDIHVECFENELVVRFRVDGMLYDVISPPKRIQAAIISRIKVMSGLNIAEKRLPQDGRIRLRIAGRDIDIRVSTIPCALRRADRAALARPRAGGRQFRPRQAGLLGREPAQARSPDSPEPRHHPGDRPDRFR